MAKLIFLEGISGVGKSTMARSLCEDLQAKGLAAKAYLEFDYTNPIDFYCVAYYAAKEYEMLLTDNPENEASISSNTINAGKARLIHYFNEDTPLFEEPLLSEFMEREFCYNPRYPVSFEGYTEAQVDDFIEHRKSIPIADSPRGYTLNTVVEDDYRAGSFYLAEDDCCV